MPEHPPTPPRPVEPGQRPAQPGEVCTCGRRAVVVYTGGRYGPTGYCGSEQPPAPCTWCGAGSHTGRCPAYRLRPEPGAPTAVGGRERITEGGGGGQRYRVREVALIAVERLDPVDGWVPLSEPAASDVAAFLHGLDR